MKSNPVIKASPFGVCAAIANFYGYTLPSRLLKSIGVKAPLKWFNYTSHTVDELLSNPIIAADMKKCKLLENIDYSMNVTKHIHSQNLAVCRQCLKEGVIHHLGWQTIETTMCLVHKTLLTNSCPHLYVDESWSEHLKCKDCNLTAAELIDIPDYLLHMYSIESDNDKTAYIDTLKSIAERMVRPFDYLNTTIRWSKLEPKVLMKLLDDAYFLGSCPSIFGVWEKLIVHHRKNLEPMGNAAMYFGLQELQAILSDVNWPNCSYEKSDGSFELLIRYHLAPIPRECITSITRIQYSEDVEDFSFQISGNMVAELLGIHPKAVTKLLAENILPVIHNCLLPDKQIFDIRQIRDLIHDTYTDSSNLTRNYINVADIPQQIYDLYNLTPEDLITEALSAKVASQIKINSTLQYVNKLQVSADGLKSILQLKWDALANLPISNAAKMLRTNKQVIQALIKEGYFIVDNHNPDLVDVTSLRKFVSEYLLINRKATFSNSRNITQKIVQCCGVQPIFKMYMNPHKTDFVVFKKSELNHCCIQHVPKRFAHFTSPRIDLSKSVRSLFTHCSEDSNGCR